MRKKCCDKHNKMGDPEEGWRDCGESGRYKSIWDSYCCENCPSLKAYREARKKTLESL